jgi:hypothetical protein
MKAERFMMVNLTLYKRGFISPLLKCVSVEERDYVLWKIHEGIYESYSRTRILAHKVVRAGFYWPNMNRNSMVIVQNCDK